MTFWRVALFIYAPDLLHLQVRRRPQRRRRKRAAGPARHLTKASGERKRRWKAWRRKLKRTRKSRGKITRRNRGGSTNRLPPLHRAQVNLQIVTEMMRCSESIFIILKTINTSREGRQVKCPAALATVGHSGEELHLEMGKYVLLIWSVQSKN